MERRAIEIDAAFVRALLPERRRDAHKGDSGRALIFAGSEGMTGAAVMAGAAALRAGTGTLKIITTASARPALYVLPEAMAASFGSDSWLDCNEGFSAPYIDEASAILIGPGIGRGEGVFELAERIGRSGKKAVFDADALFALSRRMDTVGETAGPNAVLTPHFGEMARLTGLGIEEIRRAQAETAARYAAQWGCTVLLKGPESYIASPDGRLAVNRSGNAGLAKGGSGDVLSGIVLALLSQGLSPFDAACAGAYILGASAEEAYGALGLRMLMARDVIDAVAATAGGLFTRQQ